MTNYKSAFKWLLTGLSVFSQHASGTKLRSYQKQAGQAILDSVIKKRGMSFVVIFPRQSGKNELQAQIEAYLLTVFSQQDKELVKVSPTWKPQTLNAMRRLERVLARNLIASDMWEKESGYIYKVGKARIFFLSGGPQANVVGATANVLLECDEAQDVLPAKWDKDFMPMAASTNATRVYWGTTWTSKTLLAREMRQARQAEREDGIKRVFTISAGEVAKEVPEYGKFVEEQIARMGRQHPVVKSQFFSEEIDAECGMFDGRRLALMRGTQARLSTPEAGRQYALLIDVAGEDEAVTDDMDMPAWELSNPRRDSTTVTIVETGMETVSDPVIRLPTYRVVDRVGWVGVKHSTLYGSLRALIESWRASWVVIDATGIGTGLSSFLDKAFPGRVIPFTFNMATKSKLGWDFLSVIETGRFKDYAQTGGIHSTDGRGQNHEQREFFLQCQNVHMEILPGPERRMRWAVPEGTKDPATGALIHDDWVMSAALCAVIDGQDWTVIGAPMLIKRMDPLVEMDRGY